MGFLNGYDSGLKKGTRKNKGRQGFPQGHTAQESPAPLERELRALLEAIPRNSVIILRGSDAQPLLDGDATRVVDFTVAEVAELFGKAESTIRGWLGDGSLEGYKLRNSEWRVPRAAIDAFQRGERERQRQRVPVSTQRGETPDLGAWRRLSEGPAA